MKSKRRTGNYGDWTLLRSKEVYDNPWITVVHDDVLNPSGGKGIYGRVHFKNLAIGIIPIDSKGYTYIVGQFRYPHLKYSWEIPEGGGKLNRSAMAEARRELIEETGITARRMEKLIEMDLSNSTTDERGVVFVATQLKFGTAKPDEDENLKVRRVHFNDLYALVIAGKIRDSLTVAGVLALRLKMDGKLKCPRKKIRLPS